MGDLPRCNPVANFHLRIQERGKNGVATRLNQLNFHVIGHRFLRHKPQSVQKKKKQSASRDLRQTTKFPFDCLKFRNPARRRNRRGEKKGTAHSE